MSLLNITNDGLPNVLVALHSTLLRSKKPILEQDLLDTVAPISIVEDRGMVRNTLLRWTELGLFVLNDGLIAPRSKLSNKHATSLDIVTFTRRIACRLALSEENNLDLWATHGARAADWTRSLAWMMLQDAYRASFDQFESQESKQITDSERQLMRNSTRRLGLQYWAPFFGFSRHPHSAIDPTIAVRDSLDEILEHGHGVSARQFVAELSRVVPVLDGGRWQQEVLRYVDSRLLPRIQPGQLSSALSRALMNLWEGGELLLQKKSDIGDSITLTGVGGARSDLIFQWIARPKLGENQ